MGLARKVLLTVIAVGLFARVHLAVAGNGPDTLLLNGNIYTPQGSERWVEALAIEDGVITALGDNAAVEALRRPFTHVIDLEGRTVFPGFHDEHVHPLFAGLAHIRCSIPQGSSMKETLKRIESCVERVDEGQWVTGGQWDVSALGRAPHKELLDRFSPDTPILIRDTSGHSSWANSKALEIAGVTAQTPDPEGGIIERNENGEPTGVLRESASGLVGMHVPRESEAVLRDSLSWAIETMLSYGITSYTEAALGFSGGLPREIKVYADMADAGLLKQRTRLCMTWKPGDETAEEVITRRNLYAREDLRPDCVKIFLDGVPTDSHTAAMLEPYSDTVPGRDDDASRFGLLLVDQEALNEALIRFDDMGLTVKFHAAGDAAVRAGLDAIAAAREANGFSGVLHDVGHCTFISRADIPRAREIGATLELSPYLWGPTPINDDITAATGEERIKRVWPFREALDAGALVVPGSDWAVVPSVNPWIAVETLVTREKPGGSREAFGKPQAITLEEAIQLFTENSARHEGRADKLGRLEEGMLADLIVLDRNPFDIPASDLHNVSVLRTMVNGKTVYLRGL